MEKLLSYSERIKNSLAKSFKFDIYDQEDIGQEIFLLVMAASKVYDSSKIDDEYVFYFNYVRNRLINLKRDKCNDTNSRKKNILSAAPIDNCPPKEVEYDILEELQKEEFRAIVDKKIGANVRADYLRYMEGIKLPYHIAGKLKESVSKIAESIKWDSDQAP